MLNLKLPTHPLELPKPLLPNSKCLILSPKFPSETLNTGSQPNPLGTGSHSSMVPQPLGTGCFKQVPASDCKINSLSLYMKNMIIFLALQVLQKKFMVSNSPMGKSSKEETISTKTINSIWHLLQPQKCDYRLNSDIT